MLPGPVDSIIEVRIDGELIPEGAYRVRNRRWLRRIDGLEWPATQEYSSPARATACSVIDSGDSSSIHSTWPDIEHRSHHCWAVPHPSATSPSATSATPGTVGLRSVRHGRPSIAKNVTG